MRDNFFCNGDRSLSEAEYYYNLFFFPAKCLYLLLMCENLINLAYYKDVVFGAMLIIEFLGIWNNNYQIDNSDKNKLQMWIEVMLIMSSVLEFSTLVFNFRSAFYIKA